MTSFGRSVGRNRGKSLKTNLPRESLLSLPFSSSAGFIFSPLALGLYAGGTCSSGVRSYLTVATHFNDTRPIAGEMRPTFRCGSSFFCSALRASSTVLLFLSVLLIHTMQVNP